MVLAALVFVGGALGSICRFALSEAVARRSGDRFPWGTLAVNVLGSCLIGLILGWAERVGETDDTTQLVALLAVGFCGGLTTFSSFSLQTLALLLEGRWRSGAGNVVGSTALCVATAALGVWCARHLPG